MRAKTATRKERQQARELFDELVQWQREHRPDADDHHARQAVVEYKYDVTGNPLFLFDMYLYARRHQHPYLPAVVLEYFDRVAEAMVVDTIDGSPAAYTREALELYAGNSWAWTRRRKFERKFMPATRGCVATGRSAERGRRGARVPR